MYPWGHQVMEKILGSLPPTWKVENGFLSLIWLCSDCWRNRRGDWRSGTSSLSPNLSLLKIIFKQNSQGKEIMLKYLKILPTHCFLYSKSQRQSERDCRTWVGQRAAFPTLPFNVILNTDRQPLLQNSGIKRRSTRAIKMLLVLSRESFIPFSVDSQIPVFSKREYTLSLWNWLCFSWVKK